MRQCPMKNIKFQAFYPNYIQVIVHGIIFNLTQSILSFSLSKVEWEIKITQKSSFKDNNWLGKEDIVRRSHICQTLYNPLTILD